MTGDEIRSAKASCELAEPSGHPHQTFQEAWLTEGAGRGAEGLSIRVRGVVQGVGFRPAVWRIAKRLGLCGEVLNDSEGVLIHAFGPSPTLAKFALAVVDEAPPLSRIDAVETARIEFENRGSGLIIVESQSHCARHPYDRANKSTAPFVMCPACLAEYQDPEDRRFHTQPNACPVCGPRLWLEDASGIQVAAQPYRDAIEATAAFVRTGG